MNQRLGVLSGLMGLWMMISQPAIAQFHVVEAFGNAGFIGQKGGDGLLGCEVNYCNQFRLHHGFGVKMALNSPLLSRATTYGDYETESAFATEVKYKNPGFLSLGVLYRYHFTEGIYFEPSISFGGWRERFTADREAHNNVAVPVGEVRFASKYRYPVLKLEPVFGFQTIGKRMFFVFRTGLAFFRTSPDNEYYVRVTTSAADHYSFRPSSGNFIYWNTALGLGFRK